MIYAAHRERRPSPRGSARPGGTVGHWPEPGPDDTHVDTEELEPVAAVPAPTDGSRR